MRAALIPFGAAILLNLAACAPEADAPAAEASASATAGLTVSNARVVLAPVSGNPAAVYFDLSYSGAAPVTLTGVAVERAGMTMIHDYAEDKGTAKMMMAGPITLTNGAPVSFAPGGLHVMAMEPAADWKPGGTAKVTLTLSDGTSQMIVAPIRAAGEDR
jgi:hypothetical protein